MEQHAISPLPSLTPQVQSNLIEGLRLFFSGESLEDMREHLETLQETTVTESYGELDKEDKWHLIYLIKRMNHIVYLGYEVLESIGHFSDTNNQDEDHPEEDLVTG